MFLAGLSAPNQEITWITDQDSIAANQDRLKDLSSVFYQVITGYLPHPVKAVQVGTTANDRPDLLLEDLAGIADLAAGAMAASLVPGAVKDRADVPEKVRTIVGWYGQPATMTVPPPLRRAALTVDKTADGRLHLRDQLTSGAEFVN